MNMPFSNFALKKIYTDFNITERKNISLSTLQNSEIYYYKGEDRLENFGAWQSEYHQNFHTVCSGRLPLIHVFPMYESKTI